MRSYIDIKLAKLDNTKQQALKDKGKADGNNGLLIKVLKKTGFFSFFGKYCKIYNKWNMLRVTIYKSKLGVSQKLTYNRPQ